MKVDDLIKFQKEFDGETSSNLIQQIREYAERPDVLGNIKGTPLMNAIKKLVNSTFVSRLKKDIESLVTMTKGPTPSDSSGAVAPAQRTRAATYVSPPKPILPIAENPSTPAQKRSAEQIEGIEEREETQSPKSKAKAKASATTAEAVDPSGLTLEERAKAETVLNDFMKYEKKMIDDYDITFLEDYLTDTINEDGKLQK